MFDSFSENVADIMNHIDVGLDFSLNHLVYTIFLTVLYTLFVSSVFFYPTKTTFLYLFSGTIFGIKIILFALISVHFYSREVENQSTFPSTRISNWSDIFITGIAVSSIIGVGFLFLIIPGVYFGYRLSYAIPITALHNQSPKTSLLQSWKQTKGHYLETVLVSGLTILVFGFISVGLLASYLLTVDSSFLGLVIGLLFIAHASLFEVGLFSAITSLELESHSS